MIPYYESHGDGKEVLVLLHSGGMAGEEWAPQIEYLSKTFRLLIPDLPGHGKTLSPNTKLSISVLGKSVLAMLDDAGVEKVHICGSSMGSATAMWLTLNHPERISKAVFYRMSYRKNTETHAHTRLMADPQYWQNFGLHHWLSKLHTPQGGKDAWKKVIASVSEILEPSQTEHRYDLQTLSLIKQPVFIISGDRDPICPLEDAIAMHKTIPDSSLWIIPYATHVTASNTWRKQIFAEEISRFLARNEKKR